MWLQFWRTWIRRRRLELQTSLLIDCQSSRLKHSVHPDPAHEGFEPTRARRFLRIHPEAMPTLFIKMEFDGVLRCLPAIDEAIATVREERIVGSEGDEQRRRVGRNCKRCERTVDVADEGWLRILACERGRHC